MSRLWQSSVCDHELEILDLEAPIALVSNSGPLGSGGGVIPARGSSEKSNMSINSTAAAAGSVCEVLLDALRLTLVLALQLLL